MQAGGKKRCHRGRGRALQKNVSNLDMKKRREALSHKLRRGIKFKKSGKGGKSGLRQGGGGGGGDAKPARKEET